MTLIFDLDDTLYDRCAPFVKALEIKVSLSVSLSPELFALSCAFFSLSAAALAFSAAF